jgi:hypothetical protein
LLRVEHVALTRNVFTYGATGATLRYWEFWPVDEAGWGCLPAWGVARVIEGDVDGLPVGSRLAGLLPLGSHALLQPEAVTDAALRDGAPHRRGLMAVYQRYRRLPPDASPDQRREEQLGSLLRPLVVLAAVLGDAVLAADPAPTVAVLTSASSHTARAIARELGDGVAVVGLTSPARVDELAGTGRYAAVLGYPDIDGLAAAAPDGPGGAVIVDLAGRSDLRRRARAALAGRSARWPSARPTATRTACRPATARSPSWRRSGCGSWQPVGARTASPGSWRPLGSDSYQRSAGRSSCYRPTPARTSKRPTPRCSPAAAR